MKICDFLVRKIIAQQIIRKRGIFKEHLVYKNLLSNVSSHKTNNSKTISSMPTHKLLLGRLTNTTLVDEARVIDTHVSDHYLIYMCVNYYEITLPSSYIIEYF